MIPMAALQTQRVCKHEQTSEIDDNCNDRRKTKNHKRGRAASPAAINTDIKNHTIHEANNDERHNHTSKSKSGTQHEQEKERRKEHHKS